VLHIVSPAQISTYKQIEKLRTVAKIKTQVYKIEPKWNSSTKHSYQTVKQTWIATCHSAHWLTKNFSTFSHGLCLRRSRGLQQAVTGSAKILGRQLKPSFGGKAKKKLFVFLVYTIDRAQITDCSVFPCQRFQATIRKSFLCLSTFFQLKFFQTLMWSTNGWNLPPLIKNNNYRL